MSEDLMTNRYGKIIGLATDGLLIDGGHHKQWYLEEILKQMGVNLEELRKNLEAKDYSWKEGTAP